jgi:putative aminopeptidase FrvX
MLPRSSRKTLSDLCSVPTAPFVEAKVQAFVRDWAGERKLPVSQDRHGNLLISLGKPRPDARRLVLSAHMDHPGFVSAAQDGRLLNAHFRGGVLSAAIRPGTRVRFFTPGRPVLARVESLAGSGPYPNAAVLSLPKNATVPPNTPGMFDFPPARFTKTHLHSRVCDDLAGAAAALCALDILRHDKPQTSVAVLLTRAEEVGFVGAMAAATDAPKHALLRKRHDLLLAIECSAEQPFAKQHDGVIIRVGDRTSVFNSSLTAFLTDTATELTKRHKSFKFQRALMPGGTCESTVYDAYGFHAAAVCVALGNYHNMTPDRKSLAAENVSLADFQNMVMLFTELARTAHAYQPGHVTLKQRLQTRFAAQRHLLQHKI